MLHAVGMPTTDIDYIYCDGPVFNDVLLRGNARMTLFTGSQAIADKLAVDLKGKVKLEDAGFDWKILGPDVFDIDYVAWQADQDAYGFAGQNNILIVEKKPKVVIYTIAQKKKELTA